MARFKIIQPNIIMDDRETDAILSQDDPMSQEEFDREYNSFLKDHDRRVAHYISFRDDTEPCLTNGDGPYNELMRLETEARSKYRYFENLANKYELVFTPFPTTIP